MFRVPSWRKCLEVLKVGVILEIFQDTIVHLKKTIVHFYCFKYLFIAFLSWKQWKFVQKVKNETRIMRMISLCINSLRKSELLLAYFFCKLAWQISLKNVFLTVASKLTVEVIFLGRWCLWHLNEVFHRLLIKSEIICRINVGLLQLFWKNPHVAP